MHRLQIGVSKKIKKMIRDAINRKKQNNAPITNRRKRLFFIILLFLFNCCNFQNRNNEVLKDSVNYYSEKIVIYWCPNEHERKLLDERYSNEETASDEDEIMTETFIVVDEYGYKTDITSNSSIGLIIGKDTVILHKKDFLDDRDCFKWKIILFDAKSKPIVAVPYDVAVGLYSDFFNCN
jgi:hypothetical protein